MNLKYLKYFILVSSSIQIQIQNQNDNQNQNQNQNDNNVQNIDFIKNLKFNFNQVENTILMSFKVSINHII